jgi:hypothetical protein
MQKSWQLVAVVLGPGLLSGLAMVAQTSVQSFVLGDCDMKFGCAGGVQFVAFLAAVSLLLSSVGFISVALPYRSFLRHLTFKWVLIFVVVLAAALRAMLYTFGHWPIESVLLALVAWVVISALIFWVAVALVHRLVPNNSFKPKPLRGSA